MRAVYVTVRPLLPQDGDVFGDASVVTADVRGPAVSVKMQVSMMSGTLGSGAPGRDADVRATAIFDRRWIEAGSDWTPSVNDLVELPTGDRLFIRDVQPAFPMKISLRNPLGGFSGWRLLLGDRNPVLTPATRYDT